MHITLLLRYQYLYKAPNSFNEHFLYKWPIFIGKYTQPHEKSAKCKLNQEWDSPSCLSGWQNEDWSQLLQTEVGISGVLGASKQVICKAVLQHILKYKMSESSNLVIPLLSLYPREILAHVRQRSRCKGFLCSIINNWNSGNVAHLH